ncbi:MAG: hypothetical protein DRJ32_01290 [Thermoprotei archaeon]|nr:MAG: hypothetical protein DRJ32_01290 [Thermoprotei archaeon]
MTVTAAEYRKKGLCGKQECTECFLYHLCAGCDNSNCLVYHCTKGIKYTGITYPTSVCLYREFCYKELSYAVKHLSNQIKIRKSSPLKLPKFIPIIKLDEKKSWFWSEICINSLIVKLEDIKKVLEEYFRIQARFRAPYRDRKSGKYCHKLVISGRENIKKFFRQGLTSYRTDHQQIIKELKKGQWCNDLIYDLDYALNEIKKRSEILFKKNYKEQFIVLTFKIRSPSPLKYIYYVTCYTQITSPAELDKAIQVFKEVFRGEKLVHFRIRIDYKWKETRINLKSIDEVIRKLNELGEEYERKIAEKLPEELKHMPITPTEGPVTVTMIFKDNNLTFGIDITEDYHRIEREILEYLKESLRSTARILGYTIEPHEAMEREPEIKSYYIEDGHLIVEIKIES